MKQQEKILGKLGRRKRTIARLEVQLVSGVKVQKKSTVKVPLEEKDIKRINRELETLKQRM